MLTVTDTQATAVAEQVPFRTVYAYIEPSPLQINLYSNMIGKANIRHACSLAGIQSFTAVGVPNSRPGEHAQAPRGAKILQAVHMPPKDSPNYL